MKLRIGSKNKRLFAALILIGIFVSGLLATFFIGKNVRDGVFHSQLPIVIISSNDEPITNDDMANVRMKVLFNVVGFPNYFNDLSPHFDGDVGIKLRGDQVESPEDDTRTKKYNIEIRNAKGEDMNFKLFGWRKESDWVIEGPVTDESIVANRLAYDLASEIQDYAPRTKFVEVFLSEDKSQATQDDYAGVYMFTERIKRDKKRVNVDKDNGNIIELTGWGQVKPTDSVIKTARREPIVNVYPQQDDITTEQFNEISDYINRFESALYKHHLSDNTDHYSDFIDTESFIDFIIINELFVNQEAFYESTFAHRDDLQSKLKMGPVWDVVRNNSINMQNDYSYRGWYLMNGRWTEPLFHDPEFAKKYVDRWKELREKALSDDNIEFYLEAYGTQLGDSNATTDYNNHVENLKQWLSKRTSWMDSNCSYLLDRENGKSENLPVIVIDSLGQKLSKNSGPKDSSLNIYWNNELQHHGNIENFMVNSKPIYSGNAGVAKRGQSSLGFQKRQLRWEFRNETSEEISVQLFDFPADSDFVLHGPYSDKSLMRNAVSYQLWREMGYDMPRTQFVELYLNNIDEKNPDPDIEHVRDDDYFGVYLLVEKIKHGKRRVNVSRNDTIDIDDPQITGGYIFEKSGIGKTDIAHS